MDISATVFPKWANGKARTWSGLKNRGARCSIRTKRRILSRARNPPWLHSSTPKHPPALCRLPKPICDAAHATGAIVIADTVTSLGAVPVNVDENGIDVAYSCTQKGLSCPPGLSPITVSPRAVERLHNRKTPTSQWYLDLKLLMEYYDGRKYHHTASATLFYGLREALRAIFDEGLEKRFERHATAHKALVRGLADMGLSMHVKEGHRIPHLNTPRVPPGADDAKVRKHLLEKHGIEIAGGFGPLAGKIFRIGVMGPLATDVNVHMFLDAFKEALAQS